MKYDNFHYLNNNIEHFLDFLEGDKGKKGPTGIYGPTGNPGLKGLSGPIGPQGIQGSQGDQGPRGPKGDKGQRGIQGKIGETGLKGIRGPEGISGSAGPLGDIGPRGILGPRGDQGDEGETGIRGTQGDSGFSFSMNTTSIEDVDTGLNANFPGRLSNKDFKDLNQQAVDASGFFGEDEYNPPSEDDEQTKKEKKKIKKFKEILPEYGKWHRILRQIQYQPINVNSRCPGNGAIIGVRSKYTYSAELRYDYPEKYCGGCSWKKPDCCVSCCFRTRWVELKPAKRYQKHRDYEILCSRMPVDDGEDEIKTESNNTELIDKDWGINKDPSLERYPFHSPL